MSLDLETLLDRCRQGDALAWEALVRQMQARVHGLAMHYLRDPEEARDAAQDIFIRLYERLDQFVGSETFIPWLLRLARNACIDRIRRRRARPPAFDIPADEHLELAAEQPDPHEVWGTGQRRRLLVAALNQLPRPSREVVILKDIYGLSLEEVAALLEIPVGTVKSRSSRARLELARQMRGPDADPLLPGPVQ